MKKIRKGDEVIVIAGKDKGRRGEVLRCVSADLLVVGGVNLVKKHVRPNPMKGEQGGIVEKRHRFMSPTLRCSIRLAKKQTGSVSVCWKMVAKCASSSPAANWWMRKR